jgi:hypothetical protein
MRVRVWGNGRSHPLSSGDDPDRVNNAGYVSKQREKNVQPKVTAKSYLEENAQGRQ